MVFSFVLKSLFTLSFNTAVMTMHDSFSPIPTMTSRDLGDTSPIIFQISIMHDLSPFEITFAASKKLDSFINSFFNWISRINKISGFLMMDLAVLMWSFLIVFTILWYSSDSSRDFSTASSNLFFFFISIDMLTSQPFKKMLPICSSFLFGVSTSCWTNDRNTIRLEVFPKTNVHFYHTFWYIHKRLRYYIFYNLI